MALKTRIAWKVFSLAPEIASVRYRCLLPVLAMRSMGVHSHVLEQGETLAIPPDLAAFVFVKSFTAQDVALARRARRYGVPVILDLCDNIFVPNYRADTPANPVEFFAEMANVAQAIVVPTQALADIVRDAVGEHMPMALINDELESEKDVALLVDRGFMRYSGRELVVPSTLDILPDALLRRVVPVMHAWVYALDRRNIRAHRRLIHLVKSAPRTARMLLRPQAAIARVAASWRRTAVQPRESMPPRRPERKRIIWFGTHGAGHSAFGMLALTSLIPVLSDINRQIPIELRVVSNNRPKYEGIIAKADFPSSYGRWTMTSIFAELRASDVCIIPNVRDEFTFCKSANRAVLALSLGVPVVATSIPSFQDLSSCIVLDDWHTGILSYLMDETRRTRDLAAAQAIIATKFSGRVIAAKWLDLIGSLSRPIRSAKETG